MGWEPSTALGVSLETNCSCSVLPQPWKRAAMGWCPPADLNTDWQSQCHSSPSSTMPSTCALVLLLLALCTELPPAPAQQHRGDRGNGPAASPPPHRAQRGQRPPAALPAPSKAGVCPAVGSSPTRPTRRYCLSDHSCPGAEKCCLLRDVRVCLLPTAESLGSPVGVSCGVSCCNETACGHGERCCARCLRVEPAKSGLCPRKRARRDAACPNLCTDDRDCPGDQKCCFSGCGLTCTTPYTAKSGACPVVLRGSLGPCLDRCDSDADCPGAKKCCTTGCGHVCKLPTEVRPGLCPPTTTRAGECLILCLEDKDCPPSQKCCMQDCGRTCVPPLQGTA
ncbi:WAP four-disulfide core domain protein 3 isoform X2 [Meleagris gallopavo]|uniref:WAP domain-containing protein n=1 Tax=Meleagris gallopavo TaxID=9103 RepID=G3UPF5_MELGA|nr:WAP four-disulfide core domain protein 3 isoform X2 [Meleagris gallopavo]